MYSYESRLQQAQHAIEDAEYIVIGGGAGLSDAAGLTYTGPRFTDNFADFINKYGLEDLYTSSFYPFKTEEERWAYWARHISINRYAPPAAALYKALLRLVQGKEYFVITTNVEYQFHKAGFPPERVWMVQGDYGYLQCAKACHDKLYYNEKLVAEMLAQTVDCKIPSALVPKCPVCGKKMNVYVHSDQYFIQGEVWHSSENRYASFLENARGKRVVYLELGVGFNTAGIIRIPFEQLTYQNPLAKLVRLNRDQPQGAEENIQRTISLREDMGEIIGKLTAKLVPGRK